MELYSTNNYDLSATLREAVLQGLPSDNGLYMPKHIRPLPQDFFSYIYSLDFPELSYQLARHLIDQSSIADSDLRSIIENSITFPAPLVELTNDKYILELFHGPSLAFKDFGARFMAQMMSFFNRGEDKELTILVATSGDTGGAVASGFLNTAGIRVIILYPSGKVSHLQEQQLTTMGNNVTAIEVSGTFDDCQHMVKSAFLDPDLNKLHRLSSANSINIARLIPQSFYYFEAYKQIHKNTDELVFSVPSGNYGNLTAGIFAKRMGLPVSKFIAATNVNDIVPHYLNTGNYTPKPSVQTISNAMDVGRPSNFHRIRDLYCSTWNNMINDIVGFSFDDDATKSALSYIYNKYNYVMDPHGAVGYLALEKYQKQKSSSTGIILETAHPSKFLSIVENQIDKSVDIPERLAKLRDREKHAIRMNSEFTDFKTWLQEF